MRYHIEFGLEYMYASMHIRSALIFGDDFFFFFSKRVLRVLCDQVHCFMSKNHFNIGSRQWQSGNAQNWQIGGARFKPWSRLTTQPLGIFCDFLRNSRKYEVGSLRKTPTEGTPPKSPDPTSGQLTLNLQSISTQYLKC